MTAPCLKLDNMGKAFRRYRGEWQRVLSWLGLPVTPLDEHWALRNASFAVFPGEAVGIVGQNGAGKSTLLKLITGTLRPTEGSCAAQGRIAAILELGMGFNAEFSGRQNVIHAAGLMGFQVEEILAVMPQIEAFAEIGEYFDQPVRTYSSGMQMRVAFSVATAFRPDILIVDEALSVGDAYFQQKCHDRIREYTAQGTSLLFVSHSMDAVLFLCDRAILLKDGAIVHDGPPREVIDLYQADTLVRLDCKPGQRMVAPVSRPLAVSEDEPAEETAVEPAPGSITSEAVSFESIQLLNHDGVETQTFISGEPMTIRISYRAHAPFDDPHIGFKIRNTRGIVLFETNSYCMGHHLGPVPASDLITGSFTCNTALAPGEYSVTIGFANGGYGEDCFREALNYQHQVALFSVVRNLGAYNWSGMIDLSATFAGEIKKEL